MKLTFKKDPKNQRDQIYLLPLPQISTLILVSVLLSILISCTALLEDDTAPQFENCPSNIVMETDSETAVSLPVSWPPLTVTDAFDLPEEITISSTAEPGSSFPINETTVVTYTATDANNNQATCLFSITIVSTAGMPFNDPQNPNPTIDPETSDPLNEPQTSNPDPDPETSDPLNEPQTSNPDLDPETSDPLTSSETYSPSYTFFNLLTPSAPPSEQNPFLIETSEDLLELATVVNDQLNYNNLNGASGLYNHANYRLVNSITLSVEATAVILGSQNFTPVGTETTPFEGTFDGQNNSIIGLRYHSASLPIVGFFGVIRNGTIKDLTIQNSQVTNPSTQAANKTGALAGHIEQTDLTHIKIINSFIRGNDSVGGIAGELISNSHVKTSVVTGGVTGENHIGGIAGLGHSSTIVASYTTAMVSGDHYIGGITGTANSILISTSYTSGTIAGVRSIGGLIGSITNSLGNNNTSIANSYARGAISSIDDFPEKIGGLIGEGIEGTGLSNSYWDSQTTGQSLSAVSGMPQLTAELQSPTAYSLIYEAWNIDINDDGIPDNPWNFGTSTQYPVLRVSPLSVSDQRN